MNPRNTDREWKKALTSIIEHLNKRQYKKMLQCLETVPQSLKDGRKSRVEMPQIIIQHLGLEGSVKEMKTILDQIPRRDSAVQNLLRPFVEKLKSEQNKGGPIKPCIDHDGQQDSRTKDKKRKTDERKKKYVIESESDENEDPQCSGPIKPCIDHDGQQDSRTKDKKRKTDERKKKYVIESESDENEDPQCSLLKRKKSDKDDSECWRKSIYDLKLSRYLGDKAIAGKVVQKSGLRPYQTKTKEHKALFYVGLADGTDCIKMTVYGRQRYDEIKEGGYYMFRNVIVEETVKVTALSKVSRTSEVRVPAELEMESRMLINPQWPLMSIAEAKKSRDKTEMSIEGIITDMTPVETGRKTTQRRNVTLHDENDSIRVCFWGNQAKQCRSSVGDTVRVTNVRSNDYRGTVSLNSTTVTTVLQVETASLQTGRVEIIGIMGADRKETTLEAVFSAQMKTFVVESRLLTKAYDIRLGGDFAERLLNIMPLYGNVEIQGNKITDISKM